MFFPGLLLVLLCIQTFTTAQNHYNRTTCCFRTSRRQIPARRITGYEVTDCQCLRPGVLFTLKNGEQVCADPQVEWVKNTMKTIDQHVG
ncbi:chemokine CCL-CUi precursor [Silurus asotus]|uniref:C-C motif chemokine n=1 Tax=Silurus asotus TaxID=30991 RepID=A0AAD5FQW9_SILAS|nr:chemokine CCL-CUi precursor [Silurus asotus]